MFAALQAANVDWNVAAGAFATFVVTAVVTALGFRKGFKKVRQRQVEPVPIVGASIMDNMSILMLTEALRESTDIHRQIHTCLVEIKMLLQIKRD